MATTPSSYLGMLPMELFDLVASYLSVADLWRLCSIPEIYHAALNRFWRRYPDRPWLFGFICEYGGPELVKHMLDQGADPNEAWSPLASAQPSPLSISMAYSGMFDTEAILSQIEARTADDADADAWKEGVPYSSLWWTEAEGFPWLPCLPLLDVDFGIYWKHPNADSWLPIHLAARNGSIETVRVLLDHGARTDLFAWGLCRCATNVALDNRSGFGRGGTGRRKRIHPLDHAAVTPFHVALCHGHFEVAKLLYERGVTEQEQRPSSLSSSSPTPDPWIHAAPWLAAVGGSIDVFSYLLEKDPEITNRKDEKGLTPLFYAYANGHHDMAHWLVEECRADPDVLLGRGIPLIYVACLDGQFGFAEYLMDHGAEVVEPLWGELPGESKKGKGKEKEGGSLWGATLLEVCAASFYLRNYGPRDDEYLYIYDDEGLVYDDEGLGYDDEGLGPYLDPDLIDPNLIERKKRRHDAYRTEFNRGRLALMRRLLLTNTYRSSKLVIYAAAQQSVPMLQLLLESGIEIRTDDAFLREVMSASYTFSKAFGIESIQALDWFCTQRLELPADNSYSDEMVEFVLDCTARAELVGWKKIAPWTQEVLGWLIQMTVTPGGTMYKTNRERSRALQAAYWDERPIFANNAHAYLLRLMIE